MFDLHTHTVLSDGRTRPSENARLAAEAGLTGVAVTDHDTTAGWEEAAEACAALDIVFVPGIELSTEDPDAHGRSVHLLGYFVRGRDEALERECARLRGERDLRAERMLSLLGEHGIDLDVAAVRAIAADAPVGRPHVAEALVAAGAVADTREAFDRWLAEGRPAYVGKHAITPERGVEVIRAASGAAVLAHPGMDHAPGDPRARAGALDLLDRLAAAGLAGVEADHVGHDGSTREAWAAAAAARGLLVTGASDFHGRYEEERVGSSTTPNEVVAALRECAAEGPGAFVTKGSEPW